MTDLVPDHDAALAVVTPHMFGEVEHRARQARLSVGKLEAAIPSAVRRNRVASTFRRCWYISGCRMVLSSNSARLRATRVRHKLCPSATPDLRCELNGIGHSSISFFISLLGLTHRLSCDRLA